MKRNAIRSFKKHDNSIKKVSLVIVFDSAIT